MPSSHERSSLYLHYLCYVCRSFPEVCYVFTGWFQARPPASLEHRLSRTSWSPWFRDAALSIASTSCRTIRQQALVSLTIFGSTDVSSSACLQAIGWSSSGMALAVCAPAMLLVRLVSDPSVARHPLILLSLALATASVPQCWDGSQTHRPSLALHPVAWSNRLLPFASDKSSIEQTFASLFIGTVSFRQSARVLIPCRWHGLGWRLEASDCDQN